MAAGAQPSCWTCERTRLSADAHEAIDLVQFLDLGMGWEMALEALGWRGTQEDLAELANTVATIRQERQ